MENLKIRIPITKVDFDEKESTTPSIPSTPITNSPSFQVSIYNSSSSSASCPILDITKLNYYNYDNDNDNDKIKSKKLNCLKNYIFCIFCILLPIIPIVIFL